MKYALLLLCLTACHPLGWSSDSPLPAPSLTPPSGWARVDGRMSQFVVQPFNLVNDWATPAYLITPPKNNCGWAVHLLPPMIPPAGHTTHDYLSHGSCAAGRQPWMATYTDDRTDPLDECIFIANYIRGRILFSVRNTGYSLCSIGTWNEAPLLEYEPN